ncbi:carboxylesterase family protein [Eubacteriales bacterium DFI.9.88]|nr:carboxylesterase family protein [Eubacteriales bacterium DFI.9.88]
MSKHTIAKAKTGQYRGFIDQNDIINFLGIPYAKTSQRWKRAEPLKTSDERIDAFEFGPICYQPILPEEHEEGIPMSEDCLTLNIWTDDIDKKGKPVMLWIHGGCYLTGSNRIPYYCNDKFAADCRDLVFVNINYRLGNFGSMDLTIFDQKGEYRDAPNLQTLDQMAAVKWVYENIEAFGGDPENITVYGQSAGSYSTATLLLIPEVNQYISKAICESSGFEKTQKTLDDSRSMGEEFARLAGAENLEDLLRLPAEKVLEYSLEIFENPRFPRAFASVRDGNLIPEKPYEALRAGVAKHITLMSGTVSGEYDTAAFGLPDEAVKQRILDLFGDRIDGTLIDQFVDNDKERPLREAYLDCRNDMAIRMPVLSTLEAQCASGADTYMYYIDYIPEGSRIRAQHLFEIPFFNDKLETPVHMDLRFDEPVQGHHPDRKLVNEIQGCWANFARSGNPGGEHIAMDWPPYTLDRKTTMMLTNSGWHLKDFPRKEDTELLQHFMFE